MRGTGGSFRWKPDPWRPDFKYWGGQPEVIMTDFPGKKLRRPQEVEAQPHDLVPSEWDEGRPPESWVEIELSRTSDTLTFSEAELVVRYHETKGRLQTTCGYCEAKFKSRSLGKLIRWFHTHDCTTHPIWNPSPRAGRS
jgi:hypothetical protein